MPQDEDFFESENPDTNPLEEPEVPEPGKGKKGNSRSRIFLLVLLLLVIVAAALFYVGPGLLEPEVAKTPAPPAKKEVVKLPPPDSKETVSETGKSEPSLEKGVVEERLSEQPVPVAEKAKSPAPDRAPAPDREQADAAAEAPASEEEAEPAETTATRKAELAQVPTGETSQAPVKSGDYVLQAGAYLLDSNLESTRQILDELGYRTRLDQQTKAVEMTRLKVGSYDKDTARAKREEISGLSGDVFTMKDGGKVSVYAGSYYDLDHARVFADRLYAQGVRVEEERAEVELPITIVRFGTFEDRNEAEKVADRVRDKGLEVTLVRKR